MRINKSLITYIPTSGAGSGTVTSVAMSVPSGVFTITGSPITSSGTLAVGLVNQLANTVWAGPTSGAESVPTFRALVSDDIPNLSASKITSGTLSVSRGGTGATTLSGILVGNGTSAFTALASTTSGQLLRVNTLGTAYEWFTPSYITPTDIIATSPLVWNSGTNTMSIPVATSSANGYLSSTDWLTFSSKQNAITLTTTGNSGASTLVGATLNVPEYTLAGLGGMANVFTSLGDIVYSNAAGAPLRRAGNTTTTKMFLSQTGDGTSSAAPVWEAITTTTLGAVPTTRTLTINGTTFDLSADRTFSVGTITSLTGEATASGTGAVAVTLTNSAVIGKVLTGLSVSGGTIASTDSILTAFGKLQNQVNGLVGGVMYQGTWNASTNTPTLTSSVGTKGHYYVVSVAGSTNLDGVSDWKLGDWAIFNGTSWEKVDNTDSVVSVNGYTGAVILTTSDVAEGTRLYYTDTRARASLSFVAGSGAYNSTTGVITIPTNTNQLTNGANYITLTSLSAGTGISYNNTTGVISSTITQYTDALARAAISETVVGLDYNNTTGVFSTTSGYGIPTTASQTNWDTAYTNRITSLTTTGSSGAATLISNTLNIPNYTLSGLGGVPTTRTITINDVTFDLSANRSWSVGDFGTW